MEIDKTEEVRITLTLDEARDIIKEALKSKGYVIDSVSFNVSTVYGDGDWQGMYPSEEMTSVSCYGTKKLE